MIFASDVHYEFWNQMMESRFFSAGISVMWPQTVSAAGGCNIKYLAISYRMHGLHECKAGSRCDRPAVIEMPNRMHKCTQMRNGRINACRFTRLLFGLQHWTVLWSASTAWFPPPCLAHPDNGALLGKNETATLSHCTRSTDPENGTTWMDSNGCLELKRLHLCVLFRILSRSELKEYDRFTNT